METNVKEKPATRTVTVPAVQTMPAYIKKHCMPEIIHSLNDWNTAGVRPDILGEKFRNTHFNAGNCTIIGMEGWRENRLRAVLAVQLSLTSDSEKETTVTVKMWVDMRHGLDIVLGDLCDPEEDSEFGGIRLDYFMVPYLDRIELEKLTDELLQKHGLYCLKKEEGSKAEALAEKMGLKVITLPLYKKPDTDSILYFHRTDVVTEKRSENSEIPEIEFVTVEEGTIVVNAHFMTDDRRQMAILHECVHYELHFMFYRLQEFHNSDLKKIGKKRIKIKKDKKVKNPIPWMEWQAKRGAYALLMPPKLFMEELEKELAEQGQDMYYARRLQNAEISLAKGYDFRKYRVRARAIQVGYIAAVGTLNHIGGRYIAPYGFNIKNYQSGAVYHIDPESLAELYGTDENVRRRLDSGYYVYADGHLVINAYSYVLPDSEEPYLTDYAKENADMCCLRFSHIYEDNTVYDLEEYYYGALNSDEEYNRDYFAFVDNNGIDETEKFLHMYKLLREMPAEFGKALTYLMEKSDMTAENLSLMSGVSVNTIYRRRNDEPGKVYTAEQIIPLCIGMKLPPILSTRLLELANVHLNMQNKQHSLYRVILDCMYMDSLEKIQKTIQLMGGKTFKDVHKAEE